MARFSLKAAFLGLVALYAGMVEVASVTTDLNDLKIEEIGELRVSSGDFYHHPWLTANLEDPRQHHGRHTRKMIFAKVGKIIITRRSNAHHLFG